MSADNGTPLQAVKFALSEHFTSKAAHEEEAYAFLCAWQDGLLDAYQPTFSEFCAANPDEPEIRAPDGTVRKAHYGSGRQPWDDILDAGWASHFAAGNALKYIRRHAAKNGADDVKKARWYWQRLRDMVLSPDKFPGAHHTCEKLYKMLTKDELGALGSGE